MIEILDSKEVKKLPEWVDESGALSDKDLPKGSKRARIGKKGGFAVYIPQIDGTPHGVVVMAAKKKRGKVVGFRMPTTDEIITSSTLFPDGVKWSATFFNGQVTLTDASDMVNRSNLLQLYTTIKAIALHETIEIPIDRYTQVSMDLDKIQTITKVDNERDLVLVKSEYIEE